MHYKLKGQNVLLENARETLGEEFLMKLKEIDKSLMLNHSFFLFFFDRCQLINDILYE